MSRLNKKEEKQLYICLQRVRDTYLRLSENRKTLCRRGYIIESLSDALSDSVKVLKNAETLIETVLQEHSNNNNQKTSI